MRKIVPAVVAGAATLAVAAGAFGYVALDKDVNLSVDGQEAAVSTMAGTVGDVLQSKGIELGEHDVVAPAVDTKLNDGTRIAVQYGRQIRVTVDGQQQTFWTTATRVDEALDSLDVDADGAELSTSRSTPIGREGLSFNVATRKTVTIDNAGRTQRIATTAQTVGAALAAAKITVDGDDKISLAENTALRDGASFTVTRVDVVKRTKKERVKYPTRYEDDDQLEKGKTAVETPGRNGVREVEITEVRHNGKVQSREQTDSTLATAPRAEVIRRGTKEPAPEPQPDADTGGDAADPGTGTPDDGPDDPGTDEPSTDGDEPTDRDGADQDPADQDASGSGTNTVWDRLAQCESGQNWSINTGNGYYGGLQFAEQSWKAYGGTEYAELASQASREQQIAVAKKILDDVGWKAWPACSKKLGLR